MPDARCPMPDDDDDDGLLVLVGPLSFSRGFFCAHNGYLTIWRPVIR